MMTGFTRALPGKLACLLLAFIAGCQGELPADLDPPRDMSLEEWVASSNLADTAFQELLTLTETVGEEQAKRLTAAALSAEPAVESMLITDQGIWVDFKSGASWMLVLNPQGDDSMAPAVSVPPPAMPAAAHLHSRAVPAALILRARALLL